MYKYFEVWSEQNIAFSLSYLSKLIYCLLYICISSKCHYHIIVIETGQNVAMTPQDDRMIRLAYDYMSGFVRRTTLQQLIEKKKMEVSIAMNAMPTVDFEELDEKNNKNTVSYVEDEIEGYAAASIARLEKVSSEPLDITEDDLKLKLYRKLKDELTILEDRLEVHLSVDNKITLKDLDAVLKQQYGVNVTKKQLEVSREQIAYVLKYNHQELYLY